MATFWEMIITGWTVCVTWIENDSKDVEGKMKENILVVPLVYETTKLCLK